MSAYPRLVNTVVDTTDARASAEFYRRLLGLVYRTGDDPSADQAEERDWLVLCTPSGERVLAFQQVEQLHRTTWPSPDVPMQMHLCFMVEDPDQLEHQRDRALELGAAQLVHRTDEPEEPLFVMADLDGHPFCLYTRCES